MTEPNEILNDEARNSLVAALEDAERRAKRYRKALETFIEKSTWYISYAGPRGSKRWEEIRRLAIDALAGGGAERP